MSDHATLLTKRTTCRYCGGGELWRFLSLGDQPPSNSFLRPEAVASEVRYPLDVYLCRQCYLVQLLDVVSAQAIFDEYLYLSSASKALVQHYGRLAQTLSARFGLTGGDVVVDIGCNDGALLQGYTVPQLVRVGVEPSQVAALAEQAGLHVVKKFFGPATAREITAAHGTARVVTATNVFAHVDSIGEFVDGLLILLAGNGVFVIESPYLIDLVEQALFDTIYHEHLCYLSLTPMVPFLARHGLEIFDVERVPFGASGPAIRVFVQPRGACHPITGSVRRMLAQEERWGVGNQSRYEAFGASVAGIRQQLLAILEELRRTGARIGGYGASAKGNTLLNYLGMNTDVIAYVAETNVKKQGFLTPGSHIPIISEEQFLERMPPYALLLSWNYLDFFLTQSNYIRRGGRFVVPLPTPCLLPADQCETGTEGRVGAGEQAGK